jgi:hypothetical protein
VIVAHRFVAREDATARQSPPSARAKRFDACLCTNERLRENVTFHFIARSGAAPVDLVRS